MSKGRQLIAGSDKSAPVRLMVAAVFLLMMCLPGTAGAQSDRNYAFSAGLMYGPFFPPGQWHPVQFTFRNHTDREISGFGVISLEKSEQAAKYMVPVVVPAHSRLIVTGAACFLEREPTESDKRSGAIPSVATASWELAGSTLAGQRHEIIASAVSALSRDRDLPPGPPVLALGIAAADGVMVDSQDVMGLREMLTAATGRAAGAGTAGTQDAPRHRPAFGSFDTVILDMDRLDDLDRAQQTALMDHVRAGAVLIVAAPTRQTLAGSWLEPLMPVEVIGRREVTALRGTSVGRVQGTLTLREPVPMSEAILRDGRVIFGDEHHVHVADRALGVGRVVFMDVPVNAMREQEPAAVDVWRLITQPGMSDWKPEALLGRGSAERNLGDRVDVLAPLIGLPVPPLRMAGAIALLYLAVVLALQLLIRGPARPKAFVASLVVGLLLAGVLVAIGLRQRGKQDLAAARLAVADVSASGGGLQREVLAYIGKDDHDFSLNSMASDVTIRPLFSRSGAAPDVLLDPMSVPKAEVFSQRIERIWQAEGQVSPDRALALECQFGPSGPVVSADNRMGESVQSPLVIWNGQRIRLADIGTGASSVAVREATGWDDFTNPRSFGTDRMRGQFLKAVLGSATDDRSSSHPVVAGWVESSAAPSLVQPSITPVPHALVMVRSAMKVSPSPVDSVAFFPPGFVQMEFERGAMPVMSDRGGFTESSQTGELLLGFSPPWQAGQIAPTHLRLIANLTAPDHSVRVRRGQVSGGQARFNPAGPELLKWDMERGERSTSEIALDAGDVDKDGRVWLAIVVEERPDTMVHTWRIENISAELRGKVSGPPAGPRPVPVVQKINTPTPPQVTAPKVTAPKTTPPKTQPNPQPKPTPQPKAK